MTHSTKPKSKARAARYTAWLRTASKEELDASYKSAGRIGSAFQKRAIVDEMRRRERQSEGVA